MKLLSQLIIHLSLQLDLYRLVECHQHGTRMTFELPVFRVGLRHPIERPLAYDVPARHQHGRVVLVLVRHILRDRANEHIVELESGTQVYLNGQLSAVLHDVSLQELLRLGQLGQPESACFCNQEEAALLAHALQTAVVLHELLLQNCEGIPLFYEVKVTLENFGWALCGSGCSLVVQVLREIIHLHE